MDQNKKTSFFSPYSSKDPSMEVPVTSSPAGGLVSPYLNFNPATVQGVNSDYILPEGSTHHRGRFEMAFSAIGLSVLMGASFGTGVGIFSGFREIKSSAWKRDQIFNLVKKSGGAAAQKTGVLALTFSFCGVGFPFVLDINSDINNLLSGTVTGLIYTSPGGLKKMLKGGILGCAFGLCFCLVQKSDRLKSMLSR